MWLARSQSPENEVAENVESVIMSRDSAMTSDDSVMTSRDNVITSPDVSKKTDSLAGVQTTVNGSRSAVSPAKC